MLGSALAPAMAVLQAQAVDPRSRAARNMAGTRVWSLKEAFMKATGATATAARLLHSSPDGAAALLAVSGAYNASAKVR